MAKSNPFSFGLHLKKLSEEHAKSERGERAAANFQERVNNFISYHSRPEFERLLNLVKARVQAVNPVIGDLPALQIVQNGQTIEQGNAAAYLNFDKPILNAPNNALLISFGSHRNAMFFDEQPPNPQRYRLQAAASDSLDHIVWTGDLGELTSEQLTDYILENLTRYYLEHKRR